MTNAKKRSFPIVLLSITLVFTLLFTALAYPGFALPLFSPKDSSVKVSKEGKAFSEGHSKAFSVEPTEGVIISAEENALDKDRKFKMEEVSIEEYEEIEKSYEETFPDDEGIVFKTWELDAGLKDDEILPGTFKMDFNLDTLGLAPEDYGAIRMYRIDDEGNWYEFASGIEENTLSVESNQNSIIACVLAIAVLAPAAQDASLLLGSGGYFYPSIRREVSKFYVKVDNKDRFQIVCKLPELNMALTDIQSRGSDIRTEVSKKAMSEALKEVIKNSSFPENKKSDTISKVSEKFDSNSTFQVFKFLRANLGGKGIDDDTFKQMARESMKQQRFIFWKNLLNNDGWKAYKKEVKDLLRTDKSFEEAKQKLEQLEVVSSHLVTAYKYLRDDLGLQVPTYVIQVQLLPKIEGANAYATTNQTNYANPYLVVDMSKVENKGAKAYDELLLTLCHELFHAVQRLYVWKGRANFGFDECSAMALEWDAFEDFSKKENPETHKKYITTGMNEHLENLRDINFFAIPLDEYKAEYPEGTIGYTMIGTENMGKRADMSYPKASFFRYLKKKYPVKWPDIMTRYKSLWGHRAMSTIFREIFQKEGKALYMFQLSDDFKDYVNSDRKRFLEAAKKAPEVAPKKKDKKDKVDLGVGTWIFAPVTKVGSTKADIKLPNYDLTARVRRVKIDHKNPEDKEYSLVLKRAKGYWDNLHDLDIDPIEDMTYGDDYLYWNDGERGGGTYFFKPKPFPKNPDEPVLYLLELDGAGGKVKKEAGGYSICILTPIEEPEMDREENTFMVKPMKCDNYKEDIVDSIAVTFMLGDNKLAVERIPYKDWKEPWSFDLTTLRYKDKQLNQEMLSKVKVRFQECVTGTFDSEDPDDRCLGPATEVPLPDGTSIEGTWKVEAVGSYSSDVLDPIVNLMQGSARANDPKDTMGLSGLADLYKASQKGIKSTALMTIKCLDEAAGAYEAAYVNDDKNAPIMKFKGNYDKNTKVLDMKQEDMKYTDPNTGQTYNYSDFGLLSTMKLTFKIEKDKKTKKNKLTFTGETKQDSKIVKSESTMTGEKISDEIQKVDGDRK